MHDAGPACADHSAKNEHNRANAAYYHLPNKFALNEAPRWRGPLAQRAADFIIGALLSVAATAPTDRVEVSTSFLNLASLVRPDCNLYVVQTGKTQRRPETDPDLRTSRHIARRQSVRAAIGEASDSQRV